MIKRYIFCVGLFFITLNLIAVDRQKDTIEVVYKLYDQLDQDRTLRNQRQELQRFLETRSGIIDESVRLRRDAAFAAHFFACLGFVYFNYAGSCHYDFEKYNDAMYLHNMMCEEQKMLEEYRKSPIHYLLLQEFFYKNRKSMRDAMVSAAHQVVQNAGPAECKKYSRETGVYSAGLIALALGTTPVHPGIALASGVVFGVVWSKAFARFYNDIYKNVQNKDQIDDEEKIRFATERQALLRKIGWAPTLAPLAAALVVNYMQ